ncbi:MAG: hypothetical protein AB1805_00570 [Nitrospirota bacterium]
MLTRRVVLTTEIGLLSYHFTVPPLSASQRLKVKTTGVAVALVVGALLSFF